MLPETNGEGSLGLWFAAYGVRAYAELLSVTLGRALGGGELDIPMKTPTVGLEPAITRLRALRSAD